jgi:hypothetical protein
VGPRHLVSAAHCFFAERDDGSFGAVTTKNLARLVFGQRGSGNSAANMPVDGRKVGIEHIIVPDGWIDSVGTDYSSDWAVVRMADARRASAHEVRR